MSDITIRKKLFKYKEFHSTFARPYMSLDSNQMLLVEELNCKIMSGKVSFECVPCLCGSRIFDLIASVDRHLMLQNTVLCTECGLIQSNPRMTTDEYANFYSSDFYRKCYESGDYRSLYENKYTPKEGRHIFDEINKAKDITSSISVLELGAGGGWNLLVFKNAGAEVSGLDYSSNLVSLGRSHGINMMQGSVNEISGVFDVIIINHVLEHFLNPIESIKQLIRHLKKDGVVYIGVPNIVNFSMGQIQNAHTYYFDPDTFKHYCAISGLNMVRFGVAEDVHMFGIFQAGEGDVVTISLKGHYKKMHNHIKNMMLKHYIKRFFLKRSI